MTRLAWGLFALWVALAVVAAGYATQSEEKFELVLMVALTGFAIVGALVASRRPSNPIGWMLLAIVLLNAASSVLIGYTSTADDPVSVAVWMDDCLSDTWIGLIALGIPLLYPDGRLPSPRWRPFAWFAAGCFVLGLLGRMFGDRVLDTEAPGTWHNPYALPGAAGDAAAAIAAASGALYGIAAITGFAAVVVRLRRSRGVERQQVKWFAFVGALMLTSLLLAALSLIAPVLGYTIGSLAWGSFLILFALGLPFAIGMAILRHRLYDIDVVINRTLVYGALTATLGGAYLGCVLLIGLAVGKSGFAVAVSTLAVAALFRPARAQIQEAVDRRFYRHRYDAARTLERFGGRLRDELDLDALQRELVSVVGETVQPAHASLWLRRER